jgi:hypothetical protein
MEFRHEKSDFSREDNGEEVATESEESKAMEAIEGLDPDDDRRGYGE